MLSAEHRAIVLSTVPLLESGGEALATHFYRSLLDEHPELRPFFNQSHQASGAQPRALARGVLMYARHIDELEKLGDLVGSIVSKHVSLQIQPAHYPIVGAGLLRSIRAVLGAEIATDAVLEAWGAAYAQLADILIGAEETAYANMEKQAGGWRGGRMFTVVGKTVESGEITSFRMAPTDGGSVAAHLPGQYIGLRLTVDGQDLRRNYSLSEAANGRDLRISVKREPHGVASRHLHDQVNVGDTLELFAPAGDFVLRPGTRPLVFITGGVGITPAIAMLQAAVADGKRPVTFIHATRDAKVHAFRDFTDGIAAEFPQVSCFYIHEKAVAADATGPQPTGFITAEDLARWLPADRNLDAYFLGPLPFMRAVKQHLAALGVPAEQTFHEFFGPAGSLDRG